MITKDIATSFKTSLDNAERIKTLKGSTLPSVTYEQEEIDVPLIGEDENVSVLRVPRARIVQTIVPRIEELFEKIKTLLEQTGFYDICLNFVLTGGGAQLHGINEKRRPYYSATSVPASLSGCLTNRKLFRRTLIKVTWAVSDYCIIRRGFC